MPIHPCPFAELPRTVAIGGAKKGQVGMKASGIER
jgi:hypothetical protein